MQLVYYTLLLVFSFYSCTSQAQNREEGNQAVVVQQNHGKQRGDSVRSPHGNPVQPKKDARTKSPFTPIAGSQECGEDVQRICGSKKYRPNDNFDILMCLINNQDNHEISDTCHHFLWQYKVNATRSSKFGKIAQGLCKQALTQLPQCNDFGKPDGKLTSCLIEHKDSITAPSCINFLTKIRTIIYSDFHLICDFIEQCEADIRKYKCGKLGENIDPEKPDFENSQGEVVACLEDQLVNDTKTLQPACLKQIIRISELSAEDYHLDRYLYFRCKNDRETFCASVPSGQGRVYDCLFKHKFDQQMSLKCRDALTSRQKIEAVNPNASYSLMHKCKKDIAIRKCHAHLISNQVKTSDDVMSLSSVMLCLENTDHKEPISDTCDQELVTFRQMLMEDYELSPEITHHCAGEIRQRCGGGIEKQGKTIHCLMGLAQEKEGLKEECKKALTDLIKETEPLEDYRMDPIIKRSCQPFIDQKCNHDNTDDTMVLTCLMENRRHKDMKKKCRKALNELQYFISRDFNLDPAFRAACHEEAQSQCDAYTGNGAGNGADDESDEQDKNAITFGLVMSCLYNRIHPKDASLESGKPISSACEKEVHRVIKERALDFHLNPVLEEKCRHDLGEFCSDDNHEKGSEFACLQNHLDELKGECLKEVKSLTLRESQNTLDFDNILVQECEPMLQKFCGNLIDKEDEGRIMECLIANKENMESEKCAAGVEHFQIIEMKDYNVNHKFLKNCVDDAKAHCSDKKKKSDVINCLSLLIRNAKLSDNHKSVPQVSKKCREQLTIEKLELHKNFKLNSDLETNCKSDYHKYCSTVKSGEARVIECLREHKKNLNPNCYEHLFQFERDESLNPALDFQLQRKCEIDIREQCPTINDPEMIFECLLHRKKKLTKNCKLIVNEREKEMFSDMQLNVDLMNSCKKDIHNLCGNASMEAQRRHKAGEDPEGVIYECLTQHFASKKKSKRLSEGCYRHVEFVIKEEDEDYELNAQLVLKCSNSINKLCPPSDVADVMSCMKDAFLNNKLGKDTSCMMEMAKILQEGESDIMADPTLQEKCALDLQRHCSSIPEGHGRKIACLVDVMKKDGTKLDRDCYETLDKRQQMWKLANERVNGLVDVYHMVMVSENSTYILTMMVMVFFLILASGSICGRMTKRISPDRKSR